jgi:hypothetical protein
VRTGDDVDADEFADAAGGCCTGVGRVLDGGNVAADDRSDKSGADLFIADELDVRRFYHRIGRLDHCDKAFAFNHS